MLFQQTLEALYFRGLLRGKLPKAFHFLILHLSKTSACGVHALLDATFFQKFYFKTFKAFIEQGICHVAKGKSDIGKFLIISGFKELLVVLHEIVLSAIIVHFLIPPV